MKQSFQKKDEIAKNRFLAGFRVECIELMNKQTGFTNQNIKITALNNTKWNKNRYNNFVIEYAVFEDGKQPPI